MKYLNPETFLSSIGKMPVVDVRSPSEFKGGHVTDAINIPLFADDERAIVGTIYKQEGKKDAIEKGLEIVGPKMAALAKKAEDAAVNGAVAVYCWRGGMRSNRMAWLFEQVGLKCTVMEGGYKAYRKTVLQGFSELENLIVIDGPTGSGKTDILHALKQAGEQVLDLEGLANHKGSAFGSIGLGKQPSSQQFQNDLHHQLGKLNPEQRIWIEREGMTIGQVYLPQSLWERMRISTALAIEVPMELRVERLVNDYGSATKTDLETSIRKLQQKLGGQHMKAALELLQENRLAEVAELLLKYYDKQYTFSKKKYLDWKPLAAIEMQNADAVENAKQLIALANKNQL